MSESAPGRAAPPPANAMESIPCPLCEGNTPRPVHTLADWQQGAEGVYHLVRCTACGLLYLNPRPTREAMGRHYPADYAPFQRADPRALPWWRRPWRGYGLAKRRRAVTRLIPRGRLLDVGCADGTFLAAMQATGAWDVVGLERDPGAASYARERHGIAVHCVDVDEATFDEGALDAITLWDVLEHLHSPRDTLRRIRPWLGDGGWLVIRVPDAGSPWARVFGRFWAGFDAPRHLVTFDRRTLGRLLAECGYGARAQWTLSGSHAMAVLSVYAWLRATGRPRAWGRLLDNPISQALTAPLFWLADRALGGALVTVAAQVTPIGDDA